MADGQFLSALTGSFSSPAGENPTVVMMEAGYRAIGVDVRYINCEVAPSDLADAVRGARAMNWLGFNCSLPHKVAVIRHLDELAQSARIIGAVNCTVIRAGRLIGENTDGQGFLESLRPVTSPEARTVVILGAGGAARAIAVELALAGARQITVVNRDRTRGETLAKLLSEKTAVDATFHDWAGTYRPSSDVDILVNATSIGLPPDVDASPDVDIRDLQTEAVVADVIPNPPRTPFLRKAEAQGCQTLDGLGMLINQGAVAVKLWTGRDADREAMRETLRGALGC